MGHRHDSEKLLSKFDLNTKKSKFRLNTETANFKTITITSHTHTNLISALALGEQRHHHRVIIHS